VASDGSTVVEHLTRDPKIKGLKPAPDTEREKMTNNLNFGHEWNIVVVGWGKPLGCGTVFTTLNFLRNEAPSLPRWQCLSQVYLWPVL
jgi:hypothetical protein